MKYVLFTALTAVTLAAGPASAADMPIKALPAPVPVFSWSGIYVGGFVGGAWSNIKEYSDGGGVFITTSGTGAGATPFAATFNPIFLPGTALTPLKAVAPIGGLQTGINLQMGPLVAGIESMWGGTRLRDHETDLGNAPVITCTVPPPAPAPPPQSAIACGHFTSTRTGTIGSFATLAGRLGLAWDRLLIYGKGGVAWASFHENTVIQNDVAAPNTFFANALGSKWLRGWTAGGGLEYGLNNFLSFKVEYDYIGFTDNFVDNRFTSCAPFSTTTAPCAGLTGVSPGTPALTVVGTHTITKTNGNMQMVVVGFNARFGLGTGP